jgi:hypothetical protein
VTTTGTFTGRLERFKPLDSDMAELITSPPFELCGIQWQLLIYPNGINEDSRGHLSIFLQNNSDKTTQIHYQIVLISHIPEKQEKSNSGAAVFDENKGRVVAFLSTT